MPNFAPSSVHGALATFSNPKSVGFDYLASLCMGVDWTEMARASFHLNAGESKPIPFSVTMPATLGTYPVYFKVTSGGVIIGTFVATEDVVISAPGLLVNPGFESGLDGWTKYINPAGEGRSAWRIIDINPATGLPCARTGLYCVQYTASTGTVGSSMVGWVKQSIPLTADLLGKTKVFEVYRAFYNDPGHSDKGLFAVIIDDGISQSVNELEVGPITSGYIVQQVVKTISMSATKLEVLFRIRKLSDSWLHRTKLFVDDVDFRDT